VLVRRRALRPDSAGAGQWRGALGHELVLSRLPDAAGPVHVFFHPDRLHHAPQGLRGGEDGPLTEVYFNGERLTDEALATGHIALERDEDRLLEWLPGGAGFGDPARRDPAALVADLRAGLATSDVVCKSYPACATAETVKGGA
jgi:N-methylhydantoinase B/oxoprolinase/acetone carboxylase alpha subunit